ncbi:hypothetical protein BO94DRAFT_554875 [Aspergillus sclerotioniger CBS 115572]|uniref:Uncharacterized protein n=1 Tax=Aspergillus sclerotioniger CBS 115572 TaxID=1450535 RepID=A0A317WZ52_9EURO|nr:hypothetical protein BO94DRAFT_554875 [Aspergillus sclerotioniger CBS 115572]PWY91659.1 hypothetical protein BO94DRAFT_554875 [Aspergillus sclerotioniger CBS 115572]
MQFTVLFYTLVALAISALALPTGDTREIQLRLWSENGCAEENLGELGLYRSTLNQCTTFLGSDTIRSISTEFVIDGYAAQFFTDSDCQEGQQNVTTTGCLDGDAPYVSYKLVEN